MTRTLTIPRPDDFHLHLRDGAVLEAVLPDTARHFERAIIMPNLVPPVTKGEHAKAYAERIMAALPEGMTFEPLMTLYLTDETDPEDVVAAHKAGIIKAVKLYPAGATTNSAFGVTHWTKAKGVLEAMAEAGVPLCMHGEVTDPKIDIFDREAAFIDRVLEPIRHHVPELRLVMEHITTANAAAYLEESTGDLAATITPHHLMINRNHILVGGIRPHYYCLPVAKREVHREALVKCATSSIYAFLGTDSAPHVDPAKETSCGCAGVYCAPVTLACVAQVFDDAGKLDALEDFVSYNGSSFYGLPQNGGQVTLVKEEEPQILAGKRESGDGPITVFDPPQDVFWRVLED